MYKGICPYCEDWECTSSTQEDTRNHLADHLLDEHRDVLRSLPQNDGKSSTGAVVKGDKCLSGEGHKIKGKLTPDLNCPICGCDYTNYISRWTSAFMIEEIEEE